MPKGQKIKYEDNHRIIDGVLEKKCNKHEIYFPEENHWLPCTNEFFYKNKSSKTDGLHPWCIRCAIVKSTIRQNENIEKHNEYTLARYYTNPKDNKSKKDAANRSRLKGNNKRWQQRNPEKLKFYNASHQNHNITPKQWDKCKKFFNYSCCYCGMSEKDHRETYNQQLHKDHADPNGSNDIDNCLPACKRCNCGKHDSNLDHWYNEQNPIYSQKRYDKIMFWLNSFVKCH